MQRFLFIIMAVISFAKADMSKKVELNLICKKGIQLISDGQKSLTYLNQELIHVSMTSSAGTEGADPYKQFVGGGYNITISGEEFMAAFADENNIYRKVDLVAYVDHYAEKKNYKVKCSGKVKFSDVF